MSRQQLQQAQIDTESRNTHLQKMKTTAEGISLLRNKMSSFIRQVKLSVTDSQLDATGFPWSIAKLYGKLRTINYLADVFGPLKGKDLAQMHYATYVFHLVDESATLLWLYSSIDEPSRKIVCRMVRLNLRLLRCFDSHGKPRLDQQDLAFMVFQFVKRKKDWETVFYNLKNVPEAICIEFDAQLARVNESLRALAKAIPGFVID